MKNDLPIAMAVTRSVIGKTAENLETAEIWVEKAHRHGARLICFPEMNITGYCVDRSLADVAQTVPGPASEVLLGWARDTGLIILAGVAERDEAGRIFASHLVVTPDGLGGVYRKLHLSPAEKSIFSTGHRIPVFDIGGITIGIQLCYDAHFPELTTRMALDGADIIFMPHASPRGTPQDKLDSWLRHQPARAYDNGVYVAACNPFGGNGKGLSFPGLALVIGPTGQVDRTMLGCTEGLLAATLSAETLKGVRQHRMGYFLPHRRSDLYGP